jgi:hypothetical protein
MRNTHMYYPLTSLRRVRILREELDNWVDNGRRIAEEILLGINPEDPGYDDLPATLSELPSWPAWGNDVVDEATAFTKLGDMSGWSVGAIEDAILYALQENIHRKVSRDDPSNRWGLDEAAIAEVMAKAWRGSVANR